MFERFFKRKNKKEDIKNEGDLFAKNIEELNKEIGNLEEQKQEFLSSGIKLNDPQIQQIESQILKRKYVIMFKKSAAKDVWRNEKK